MKQVRALIWQAVPGSGLGRSDLEKIASHRPDVVVLPEYFWARPGDASPRDSAAHFDDDLKSLGEISRRVDAIWVGGTLVEPGPSGGPFNTCFVFDSGREAARYRKRRLMPGEERLGLKAGTGPVTVPLRGLSLGLLVCADVLDIQYYLDLAPAAPDLVAVPTNSPYRPDDSVERKISRDESYFVAGARAARAHVLKACTTGRLFGRPVQGRSLVAGPEGVVTRVPFDREMEPWCLVADLSLPSR